MEPWVGSHYQDGEERKYIGVRQLARFLKENPCAID